MATVITPRSESVLHYLNPIAMVRNLWQHRDLIRQFTKREIEGRYKGSFLGLFWSFVNPLVLLLIYTFVFGVVFQSRWAENQNNNLANYAVLIFCGLIAFNLFSECVNRSSTLVTSVPNYVKKVVFPLEILPVSSMGAALFHSGVSLIILIAANFIISGKIVWTVIFLPIIMLPLFLLCLGISWFLSSLGVYVRDVNYITSLTVQILFFITPIFYPLSQVPVNLQYILRFNPLTSVTENFRRILITGAIPSWSGLVYWSILTSAIALVGYAWFMHTKSGFADVL